MRAVLACVLLVSGLACSGPAGPEPVPLTTGASTGGGAQAGGLPPPPFDVGPTPVFASLAGGAFVLEDASTGPVTVVGRAGRLEAGARAWSELALPPVPVEQPAAVATRDGLVLLGVDDGRPVLQVYDLERREWAVHHLTPVIGPWDATGLGSRAGTAYFTLYGSVTAVQPDGTLEQAPPSAGTVHCLGSSSVVALDVGVPDASSTGEGPVLGGMSLQSLPLDGPLPSRAWEAVADSGGEDLGPADRNYTASCDRGAMTVTTSTGETFRWREQLGWRPLEASPPPDPESGEAGPGVVRALHWNICGHGCRNGGDVDAARRLLAEVGAGPGRPWLVTLNEVCWNQLVAIDGEMRALGYTRRWSQTRTGALRGECGPAFGNAMFLLGRPLEGAGDHVERVYGAQIGISERRRVECQRMRAPGRGGVYVGCVTHLAPPPWGQREPRPGDTTLLQAAEAFDVASTMFPGDLRLVGGDFNVGDIDLLADWTRDYEDAGEGETFSLATGLRKRIDYVWRDRGHPSARRVDIECSVSRWSDHCMKRATFTFSR